MRKYCSEIIETNENFQYNFKNFQNNHIYKNSISMAILQIGELINHLSKDFLDKTKSIIPWQSIKSMRNRFAHGYLDMDMHIIFDTSVNDIPKLYKFLNEEINNSFKINT